MVVAAAVAAASFTIRGAPKSQWSAGPISKVGSGARHGSANTTSYGVITQGCIGSLDLRRRWNLFPAAMPLVRFIDDDSSS